QSFAIVQLAADRRRTLTDGDAPVGSVATDLDMDDAGFGLLAGACRRAVSARQHIMCGDRGMSYEPDLGPRRKEPRTQVVVGSFAVENERGVRIIQLTSDREHLCLGEVVC